MLPHSSQDDDAYRTEEERAAAVAADPLPRLRTTLLECGALTAADADALRERIRAAVLADEDAAVQQPEPDPGRARRWLFKE